MEEQNPKPCKKVDPACASLLSVTLSQLYEKNYRTPLLFYKGEGGVCSPKQISFGWQRCCSIDKCVSVVTLGQGVFHRQFYQVKGGRVWWKLMQLQYVTFLCLGHDAHAYSIGQNGFIPQLIAIFISERLLPVAHPTLVGKNHASMYNNQAWNRSLGQRTAHVQPAAFCCWQMCF